MAYQNTNRTILRDSDRLDDARLLGKMRQKNHLRARREASKRQVVAMEFISDEPTGRVEIMNLVELWTRNKTARDDFILDKTSQFVEWRFNKRRRPDGSLKARSRTAVIENPLGQKVR